MIAWCDSHISQRVRHSDRARELRKIKLDGPGSTKKQVTAATKERSIRKVLPAGRGRQQQVPPPLGVPARQNRGQPPQIQYVPQALPLPAAEDDAARFERYFVQMQARMSANLLTAGGGAAGGPVGTNPPEGTAATGVTAAGQAPAATGGPLAGVVTALGVDDPIDVVEVN